jgi:probable HAF family extracellular repeat protein
MRSLTQLIASTMLLAVSPVVFAADYLYVQIDVPNSVFTDARGISARGDVVGAYRDADDVSHGFLLRNGVFTTIDVPEAMVTFGARAINARGDIVGTFLDADLVQRGYLLQGGQFTRIEYPGASGSFALGINDPGDITGSFFDDLENVSGFILKDGAFHNVHVPGSLSTDVYSAQDNGRVLVGLTVMESDGGFHGFILYKSGDFQLIDFPDLLIPCTAARWINQRGDIVGGFAQIDNVEDCTPEEPHHGFLLRDGQYLRIDVPGSTSTKGFAINDAGVIVGNFTDTRGNTHGFMATPRN